jgi:hypothetical protein
VLYEYGVQLGAKQCTVSVLEGLFLLLPNKIFKMLSATYLLETVEPLSNGFII